MSADPVGIVTLLLGIVILFSRVQRTFQILIFSVLFQAAAAVQIGGMNIVPPSLLLAFAAMSLFVKSSMAREFEEAIVFPRAGFWFALFTLWCAIAAFFLPRIFQGMMEVYPIVSNLGAAIAFHPEPLSPSNGNITQLLYLGGSLFVFLAIYTFASRLPGAIVICDALIMVAIGNVLFAFLDVVGSLVGHPELLDPIHNAGYAMHTNENVAGLHRISGSFSETASFAFFTLGTLSFTGTLWLNSYRSKTTLLLSACQLALLLASTSTTAYVGLLLVAVYFVVKCCHKVSFGRANGRETAFVFVAPMIVLIVTIATLLNASAWNKLTDFLNAAIFDKGTTDSALERGALNSLAIETFVLTGGMGAGAGSVRASSFPLALLSNVGVPGALLYVAFLMKTFFGGNDRLPRGEPAILRESARAGAFASLIAATISGALVDMGLLFVTFAALACATSDAPASTRQRHSAGMRPDQMLIGTTSGWGQ